MKKETIDKTIAEHYTWGNNCDSWVLLNTEGLSVKQESMPPGTREQLHFHSGAQQFFFILNGTAAFYIAGEKVMLNEKQGLHVQPGEKHLIANEADKSLDFLVISQPTTNNDRTLAG